MDRSLSCPLESTVTDGFAPSSDDAILDDAALKNTVTDDVKVTAILIRRVQGVPIYRYLSNGTSDDIFQPWSSSKFMAVAGAGANLRLQSNGKVGLTAMTGDTPLGDLITIIASYREDVYTSNGLARYFLDIAGRPAVGSLVHDWLGRPSAESYGGNYGATVPADLGYDFTDTGGSVTITPDDRTGISNALSTRTLAEFMKRLAVWDDAATRMPNLAKEDLETLFYGPTTSKYFPIEPWGGLSADIATPVENALDLAKVEGDSQGRWRVFGKVGWGHIASRGYERVNVTYTCLPVLDAAGRPVPDRGAEFVIATKMATPTSDQATTDASNAAFRSILDDVILKQAQAAPPDPKDASADDAGDGAGPVDFDGKDGGLPSSNAKNSSPPNEATTYAVGNGAVGCSMSVPAGGSVKPWLALSALAGLARRRRPSENSLRGARRLILTP